MPDVIKAALTTSLLSEEGLPCDLQYMPPGTHRINASRNGKPVSLDITVDASTADRLNDFLQDQLTKASEGNDDRPFFDFNHEDREAAAWPTEFYWAGDDPLTGGVRAKIEWSGAGKKAVTEKTFRRFSPTFVPDEAGHVIGSETNMGGLVNRAAFKTIQPLFARHAGDAQREGGQKSDSTQVSGLKSQVSSLTMARLDRTLELVEANWSDESRAASERARRAMGWPGLSQTWGDGRGGAGPSRKPIVDPKAPDGDGDPDFQDEERRSMDEIRERQREREARFEDEGPSTGDGDPEFQEEERRSMEELRERQREREERLSDETPGRTFEEIASDPEALSQLSDLDLIEFQEFTTGETRERFREEARRRQNQDLPRAK